MKYRLSEDGYHRYYTNTLRIKLSRFLYDEGARKVKKPISPKSTLGHQHHTKRQTATTVELFGESDLPVTITEDSHSCSDQD